MVKQSPFQTDLFDFTYIEEQVKKIKKAMPEEEEATSKDDSMKKLMEEHTFILNDLEERVKNIEKNRKKRKWF